MPILRSSGDSQVDFLRRPSAVFALTEMMTIAVLQTIREAGLEMPDDISLLAFDDCEWFRAVSPSITTLSQPVDDFADQAWSMLMARLNNDRSPTLRSEVHCTLVTRESTIAYRGQPVSEQTAGAREERP